MALIIDYTTDQDNVRAEVNWCHAQGWQDWSWFWNNEFSYMDQRVIFQFEDHRHAHWFLIRWGGTIREHL
jgi:hypothetical protein